MRKFLIGLLTAVALSAGSIALLPSAPASAGYVNDGTTSMVTKAEWAKVKPGMTRAQVARILDGPGILWWTANDGYDQYRLYRANWGSQQALVVWFDAYTYGEDGRFRVWDKYRSTNPNLNWRIIG